MQAGKVVLPLEPEDRRQGTKIYPVLKAVAHRILTLICIFLSWLKSFLLDAWLKRIFPLFTYNPYLAGYLTKAWQRRASGNQHLISWSWSASETSWMLHSNDFFSTVQEHTTYHMYKKRATGKRSKSVCKAHHARLSPTARCVVEQLKFLAVVCAWTMPQKCQKIQNGTYIFPAANNSEENRENSIFSWASNSIFFKFPPKIYTVLYQGAPKKMSHSNF